VRRWLKAVPILLLLLAAVYGVATSGWRLVRQMTSVTIVAHSDSITEG
jgi:hypothetical protein